MSLRILQNKGCRENFDPTHVFDKWGYFPEHCIGEGQQNERTALRHRSLNTAWHSALSCIWNDRNSKWQLFRKYSEKAQTKWGHQWMDTGWLTESEQYQQWCKCHFLGNNHDFTWRSCMITWCVSKSVCHSSNPVWGLLRQNSDKSVYRSFPASDWAKD